MAVSPDPYDVETVLDGATYKVVVASAPFGITATILEGVTYDVVVTTTPFGIAPTVETTNGHLVVVAADTLTIEQSAAYSYDIVTLIGQTSTGSLDVTIKIDGVTVTDVTGTITSTPSTLTATALNSVSVGQKVTMVIASLSSPADFAWTLKTLRT